VILDFARLMAAPPSITRLIHYPGNARSAQGYFWTVAPEGLFKFRPEQLEKSKKSFFSNFSCPFRRGGMADEGLELSTRACVFPWRFS